jgi:IS30 family transposase
LPQQRVIAIERLRRVRMTAAEIAEVLELPHSTVSLWLKRIGLGKRSRLDPLEPPNRYEHRHPASSSTSASNSSGSDPAGPAPTARPNG